jgi:hypothetical protein
MFWQVENNFIANLLGTGIPNDFDADDRADLDDLKAGRL